MKKYLLYLVLLIFFDLALSNVKEIHILTVDGAISPVSASYLIENINQANTNSGLVECIIIQLDTPGGLMNSMRDIIKEMLKSDIPIIVYVSPQGARAGSAGVFITYAADIAAMSPGTNIGAAHPINIGGGFSFQKDTTNTDVLKEKVVNDAVAYIKSLAKNHNRNIEWAQKSVTESASITASEALELNVINLMAKDMIDLLEKIHGRKVKDHFLETQKAKIVEKNFRLHHKILDIISDPNVAYILMVLGFMGLVFEIRNPGVVFPGVFGAACLILAFFAFQILPLNFTGVALIFLSIIFFILEVYVTSFGLLTIGGLILMVLGSMMLIDFTEAPREIFAISLYVILPIAIFTAAFFIVAFSMALKTMKKKVTTGKEGMLGLVGNAISEVNQEGGQVRVHGEIWNAISKEDIKKNTEIEVKKIENMKLYVIRKT